MFKPILFFVAICFVFSAAAAELTLDFSQVAPNGSPTGFVSTVSGAGQPGEWKIIQDEVPPLIAPLSPNAPKTTQRPVLAQLSQDSTDEHFPLLIFSEETFGDFTFTTRFKCVRGSVEQMAGVAFRIQDAKNFYVLRASALGNSFRFYKVVNGERSAPIGPQIGIPSGVWQEMTVDCKGNQIRCSLNGKELIPALTDNSFPSGKIGFWTKSDSVSYFADAKINYIPRISMAQKIIDDMMERYPRLIGLKIFAQDSANELRVIASNDKKQLKEPAAKVEHDVVDTGNPYYARGKETASVIMPLKDRNGETVGVLRVILNPFPGQTERNALSRALPIVKAIEARIISAKDLTE